MKGYPYSFYIPWEKRIFSSTIGNIKPAGPWTSEHNCFSGWHVQTPSSSATGNKSDYHPLQNSSVLSLLIYTLKRQCFISFSNILMIKCTLDKLTRNLRAADSGQLRQGRKTGGQWIIEAENAQDQESPNLDKADWNKVENASAAVPSSPLILSCAFADAVLTIHSTRKKAVAPSFWA